MRKKILFIVLVVFLLTYSFVFAQENKFYSSGEYVVGEDIPEGEYQLIIEKEQIYSSFKRTEDGFDGDIIEIENFNAGVFFVTLKAGEYFSLNNAKAYPISSVFIYESKDGNYYESMYRVGIDIPQGEYLLTLSPNENYASFTRFEDTDEFDIIQIDNFEGNRYFVTVKDGEYFKLNNCFATPVENINAFENANDWFTEGMYRVGVDISAGDYKLTLVDGEDFGSYKRLEDTDDFDILEIDNFSGNGYFVSIFDGEYLDLNNVIATPIDLVEPYISENGIYPTGMYRVGVDIPEGNYFLNLNEGEDSASYKTVSNIDDYSINEIELFEENGLEISLQNDEYLILSRCYLISEISKNENQNYSEEFEKLLSDFSDLTDELLIDVIMFSIQVGNEPWENEIKLKTVKLKSLAEQIDRSLNSEESKQLLEAVISFEVSLTTSIESEVKLEELTEYIVLISVTKELIKDPIFLNTINE